MNSIPSGHQFGFRLRAWLSAWLLSLAAPAVLAQGHDLLVLVSIDGLKPEAILEADSHGLKVPNLRALLNDGAYATGVRGVLPTVTYPSHMTLMTGASPARHGILSNTTFDPLNRNAKGWYWYAEDVHAETLWDAAAAARLKTASVYWPTSVGANIGYNLPQIWRNGTSDDQKLQRALSTPGLEQSLSAELGTYPGGKEESVAADETTRSYVERLEAMVDEERQPAGDDLITRISPPSISPGSIPSSTTPARSVPPPMPHSSGWTRWSASCAALPNAKRRAEQPSAWFRITASPPWNTT